MECEKAGFDSKSWWKVRQGHPAQLTDIPLRARRREQTALDPLTSQAQKVVRDERSSESRKEQQGIIGC